MNVLSEEEVGQQEHGKEKMAIATNTRNAV